MTTKDIIFRYLKRRKADGVNYISSVHFEIDVPKYGVEYWQTTKLPSAYSREWRKIRENKEYKEIGIEENTMVFPYVTKEEITEYAKKVEANLPSKLKEKKQKKNLSRLVHAFRE